MKKHVILILCVISFSGCMPQKKQIIMTEKFNAADYTVYKTVGKYRVTGQAFMRQAGGVIVTCAGKEVSLMPNTPFLQEKIRIIESGASFARNKSDPEDESLNYTRKAVCDAQGNFAFENIPALPWVIETTVQWFTGQSWQGGTIRKEVNVTKDERVLITN